jgi:hypothetical protein
MTHQEAVEKFRQAEDVESVLVLLGKDTLAVSLRKVALAWPKVPVKLRKVAGLADGPELWDALWQGVEINLDELGAVSNTRTACSRYVAMLRGYRLIYPDGTLATVAQKALRALAKAELGL